jgi:hypothetical protein
MADGPPGLARIRVESAQAVPDHGLLQELARGGVGLEQRSDLAQRPGVVAASLLDPGVAPFVGDLQGILEDPVGPSPAFRIHRLPHR